MDNPLQVLVSGKNAEGLDEIVSMLAGAPNIQASTHLLTSGGGFPWVDAGTMPEALILSLDREALIPEPLCLLGDMPPNERPPTLVVGSGNDVSMVRFAMRSGARDFLSLPVEPRDLISALVDIARERKLTSERREGELTAVISANGGGGASFIAANLAHMMTAQFSSKTVLVDLDLQFGVLPLYFDLAANAGLVQAVDAVDTLDEVAVEGWMLKHDSGLHVLANGDSQLILPGEVSDAGVGALLSLLKRSYAQVVVDLPRQIDPLFAAVAEHADRVVVVLQQSLANLRHAKNLNMVLTNRFGLPFGQVQFVVNRWDKNGAVTRKEIGQVLGSSTISTLSSDWRRVSRSLDAGVPILDEDARAPIVRELSELTGRLIGRELEKKSLFGRFMKR